MNFKNLKNIRNTLGAMSLFLLAGLAMPPAFAQDVSKQIVGRWYVRSDVQNEGYKFTLHSVQEYFPNGAMTENKQHITKFIEKDLVISCIKIKDYSWSATGNMLYQKPLSENISIDFVTLAGQVTSDALTLDIAKKVCEASKGGLLQTTEFRVKKIDDKENIYSYINDDGVEKFGTDLRTQYRMPKYLIKKGEY